MWWNGQRGNYATCLALPLLSVTFLTSHSRLCPFRCWFLVYIWGLGGPLQQSLLWDWEFLPLPPLQVFTARGFEALVFHTGTLDCIVCLSPQLFLLAYPLVNVRPPGSPHPLWSTSHCMSSLPQLPISTLPTSLNEYFFFNSLVVRLPYSLTVCQFWLFFVFKLVVALLLVVRGSEVYLPTPTSWLEAPPCLFLTNFTTFSM